MDLRFERKLLETPFGSAFRTSPLDLRPFLKTPFGSAKFLKKIAKCAQFCVCDFDPKCPLDLRFWAENDVQKITQNQCYTFSIPILVCHFFWKKAIFATILKTARFSKTPWYLHFLDKTGVQKTTFLACNTFQNPLLVSSFLKKIQKLSETPLASAFLPP